MLYPSSESSLLATVTNFFGGQHAKYPNLSVISFWEKITPTGQPSVHNYLRKFQTIIHG